MLHAQGLPLIRNYTAAEYGGHNRCYDIEIGDDGTVFVANFEGLLYYDRSRWRIIKTPDLSRVTVVYRDSGNTIWVGGYNYFARLQRTDNGVLTMQQVGRSGLFKGEVMEIFETDGSLQFLVSDNCVYEVSHSQGSTLPAVVMKQHLNTDLHMGAEPDIISLERLKAGEAVVVMRDITQTEPTDDGIRVKVKKNEGLIIADSTDRELFTLKEADGLCSNQVAYVAYDGHGMLWGATSHGIFSIELPSAYSYILAKDGLSGEAHTIAAFDGKIYVGGTNGLYSISSRRCQRVEQVDNICWALCPHGDVMLAATSSGIYRVGQGGSVSRLTSNATTAMMVDGNKVYAGEPDAVWQYDLGPRASSLASRIKISDLPLATDIRSDGRGKLWMKNVHGQTRGTDPGKPRMPLDELPDRLLNPLSDIDVKAQFRQGGEVWLGGDEIVAVIDTGKEQVARLTAGCRVRFTSIELGTDSVLWGGFGEMPQTLRKLDSDHRQLHFYYALEYAQLSGPTLYRYRLNKDDWSSWSEKQDIEFLNIPYGSYTLYVQARQATGELSEPAAVSFSIAYPLPMRWYMVVLYFLVAAYLVYLFFRYRLKRLKKEKLKLERIVEERTAEVVRQKDEMAKQEKMATVGKLTQGLIDRILNPMNYIINFSKMSNDLLRDLRQNIEGNKEGIRADDYDDTIDVLGMLKDNLLQVDQYGQNTTRILKAMEEMLKDRTGGYVETDLLPVLQQDEAMVGNYFAREVEQYHIQTLFDLPAEAMPLHGNPDMLSKTVMNLMGNAVYAVVRKAQRTGSEGTLAHTQYAPEVSLTAAVSGQQYILTIRDNGIGIEEKILPKIFDPFFTTKTTNEATGIGLYLSREIIQNHGGDITVRSVKDEYTEFTIKLPRMKMKSEK